MLPNSRESIVRNLITFVMLFFFLLYCTIVWFKTSVTFGTNEIAFSSIGAEFVCNADCMEVVNVFIYKEIFDHLRTASVSLLIGFVVGLNLLGTAHAPRRRFAIAIALCGPVVIASAFLGEVQMGVRGACAVPNKLTPTTKPINSETLAVRR